MWKIPANVVGTFKAIEDIENAVDRADANARATDIFRKNPGIEEVEEEGYRRLLGRVTLNSGDVIRISELALAAFLELKGFPGDLILEGRRVVFIFPATHEVRQAMRNFNAGEPVSAVLFSQIMKSLKSKLLIMRDSG